MNPLISIIIPIYNAEKCIIRLLDSIFEQTLNNLEIICVNDCSKDNTLQIINKYAEKDKRIIIINNEINIGASLSRNKGLELAKGKYISFLDSDDLIQMQMYENLYNEAEKLNLDMIRCDVIIKDKNNERINLFKSNYRNGTPELTDYMIKLLIYTKSSDEGKGFWCSAVWNKLYKKEFLDSIVLKFISEREYPYEDFLFNLIFLLAKPKIGFISEANYIHFNEENSLSKKYSFLNFFNGEKTLNKTLTILENTNPEFIERLYYRYWSLGFFGIINEIRNNPEGIKKMKNIYSICTNKMVLKSTQNIKFRQIEKFNRSLELLKLIIWFLMKFNSKIIRVK